MDPDFRNNLKQGDLFFLDRGFRDIKEKLENDFGLEIIIPFLQQGRLAKDRNKKNNSKDPLSCIESSRSRVCTKIRSMVERVFGMIKNHYALDFIRNTQVGHIGIDLRNVCAFYNFTFKPKLDDKPNTIEVAQRLKRKLDSCPETNPLEFLIGHHRLTTKKKFKQVKLKRIRDFVRLKRKYLKKKVFFGSFHLKMSIKYMVYLIKRRK